MRKISPTKSKRQKVCYICNKEFYTDKNEDEVESQFECLGKNTEKYITFSVPIKKNMIMVKEITSKVKFIDSLRFMLKAANLNKSLKEIKIKNFFMCVASVKKYH